MANASTPSRSPGESQANRERSKGRRGQQKGKGRSRLLTQIQYTADDQYLLIGKTETPSSLFSDAASWEAPLESLSSFHFSGKNGRFTACKEKIQGKYYYWSAFRKHHNKLYKQYIGTTAKLSPQSLEQVAATLQTRITEGSHHCRPELRRVLAIVERRHLRAEPKPKGSRSPKNGTDQRQETDGINRTYA